MKATELIARQDEMLELLRQRALNGDNEAAKIYLDTLQIISDRMSEWQQNNAPKRKTK